MPKSATTKTIRATAPYAHVADRLNETAFNRLIHKYLGDTTIEAAAVKAIQAAVDGTLISVNELVARRMLDAKRKLITEAPYESEAKEIATWNKAYNRIPEYYFKNKNKIFNSMPARKVLSDEEKAAVKIRRAEHAARSEEEKAIYKAEQKIVRAAKAAATRATKKAAAEIV